MTELTPRARALFEAARRSLQPSDQDRERIFVALSERLGAAEPPHLEPPHGEPSRAPRAASVGWQGVSAVVVGLALGGAGVFAVTRPGSQPLAPPAVSSVFLAGAPPVSSVGPALPPLSEVVAPEPSATVEKLPADVAALPHAGARSSASAGASDRLAEEVALLSQAERDLRAGRYQDALRKLDEHRKKFPNGTLAQERIAARIQALCGLGRVSEAQAELEHLTRVSPKSPHGARARACATDP